MLYSDNCENILCALKHREMDLQSINCNYLHG